MPPVQLTNAKFARKELARAAVRIMLKAIREAAIHTDGVETVELDVRHNISLFLRDAVVVPSIYGRGLSVPAQRKHRPRYWR